MKELTDIEWLEKQKFGAPLIKRDRSTFLWHVQTHQFGKPIIGNGGTLLEAIANCRRAYDQAQ